MAERSRNARSRGFSRGRLYAGLLIVCILAAGVAFGIGKFRRGPSPGTLIFSAKEGVFAHDLATGRERRLVTLPKDTAVAIPSRDGRWVGYGTGGGEVWLAQLDGRTRFQVADRFTLPVGWTPDNRLVCEELLSDGDLVAVDPNGGRKVLLTGGYAKGAVPVFVGRDTFAISSAQGEAIVVKKGAVSTRLAGVPLAGSSDGSQISYLDGGEVKIAKLSRGKVGDGSVIFKGHVTYAASSPQGFLAIATSKGVWVFEGGTTSRRVVTGKVDGLTWAPTGAALVYGRSGALFARELGRDHTARVSGRGTHVLQVLSFVVAP